MIAQKNLGDTQRVPGELRSTKSLRDRIPFGMSRSDFVGEERDTQTPRFIWAVYRAETRAMTVSPLPSGPATLWTVQRSVRLSPSITVPL